MKNRIEETAKYIRPKEGTVDFAFMFIPAEGVYYDLLVNKIGTTKASTRDLIEYAVHEKNVHIVSPTTFMWLCNLCGKEWGLIIFKRKQKKLLKTYPFFLNT